MIDFNLGTDKMVDASMQANIEQQLERLLSQLSDIEEV